MARRANHWSGCGALAVVMATLLFNCAGGEELLPGAPLGTAISPAPPPTADDPAALAVTNQGGSSYEVAYLRAVLAVSGTTTLVNPRAAAGEVFYITDILHGGDDDLLVMIPPELGVGPGTGAARSFAQVGPTSGPVSLSSPLALVTTIEVVSQGGNRPVVFIGYYAGAQPVIEDM